jgi:hypothetical protein
MTDMIKQVIYWEMSSSETSFVPRVFRLWGAAGSMDGEMERNSSKDARKGKNHDPLKGRTVLIFPKMNLNPRTWPTKHPDVVNQIKDIMDEGTHSLAVFSQLR